MRFYFRKTKGGGRGSGYVSPKGKQKELEVFPYGPLLIGLFLKVFLIMKNIKRAAG